MGLFKRLLKMPRSPIRSEVPVSEVLRARLERIDRAGNVDGRHYTTYVDEIKVLKRERRFEEAETLLMQIVDATEREARLGSGGVAPAYYLDLAIIYRKQGRTADEIAILERYAAQTHAAGVMPEKLLERLRKLKVKSGGPSES
ncbi:MAG: hypothetical protein VYC34_04205 [Planctomycetota bacterium]|nr:hypothetical protein [Planctomycetota bacterium]